ncbi:small integral membrane protein 35 isoform X2 [Gallus gallus]|uniref:small integral membrane protein 35 isoform X2 n=1 Tax=Gallus gallus TaxID=9031 RepID=UPI001AE5976E|nr:small integral membrane protein 35 isoform X2 [Gallus gallus]
MSLHGSAWVCTALALMPASSRGNCVPVHGLLQTTCTPNAGRGGAEGWNSVGIAHSPRFPPGDARNPKPPRGICLQSPFSFCFVGQGLISVFGFILDIGLALLILIISGYAVFLCYQQGWCWCRPDFIFNLYHGRLRGCEQQGMVLLLVCGVPASWRFCRAWSSMHGAFPWWAGGRDVTLRTAWRGRGRKKLSAEGMEEEQPQRVGL